MNRRLTSSFVSLALSALVATGLSIKTDLANAQQAAEELDEIIVEGPIVRRVVGRSALGGKIEEFKISQQVSYADLDLSKPADVTKLERRIESTAKKSCEKLSDIFPFNPSDRREIRRCTNRAIDGTEEQVQAAIAAAS